MHMDKVFPSEYVYTHDSLISGAGRGVFARKTILKGTLIERCPFIEVPLEQIHFLNESFLVTYFFYFGDPKERVALALGYGSLYNHSRTPNAKYQIQPDTRVIEFMALQDIVSGEEITFDYSAESADLLWFEVDT